MDPPPDVTRLGARRILLFLLALLFVWAPLQLLVWPRVQPWYSARVAGTAGLMLAVLEWGERLTTLRADGVLVHIHSGLSGTVEPVISVSADILHFYVALVLSLVLVWPGIPAARRALLLAGTAAGLFVFHVVVMLIKVEHVYAVDLAEVSLRNYSDAERWFWHWLHDTTIFLAIPIVPAMVLVMLFVANGFGQTAPAPAGRRSQPAPSARWKLVSLSVVLLLLATAVACIAHGPRIAARQGERRSMLGYQALAEGDGASALTLFDGAIALDPAFAAAHLGRGDALSALGRSPEAAEAYRSAIACEPERAVAHFKLGNALLAGKDLEGAASAYRAALERDPRLREARINLAQTLGRLKKPAESEQVLVEALESNPDDRDALLQLSALLIGGQRACEAMPHLQRLRVLGPPPGREALVEETVEQLQGTCAPIRSRP